MWICILTSTPRILNVTADINAPAEYDSLEDLIDDLQYSTFPPEDCDHTAIALNTSTLEVRNISNLIQRNPIDETKVQTDERDPDLDRMSRLN